MTRMTFTGYLFQQHDQLFAGFAMPAGVPTRWLGTIKLVGNHPPTALLDKPLGKTVAEIVTRCEQAGFSAEVTPV